jgi:hypothetical protein
MLLGLTLLTRSVIIVFIPLALGWELIHSWPNWRAGIAAIMVISITLIGIYLPWIVRNYQQYQTIKPITAPMGYGLWGGNNSKATGTWIEPRTSVEKEFMKTLSPIDRYKYAMDQGFYWIQNNPFQFMKLVGLKISCLFSLKPEGMYKGNFFGKYVEVVLPAVTKAALWILTFFGILFSIDLWRRLGLIYALLISHLIITVIFFSYARYLVPIIPGLAILAACGVTFCIQEWEAFRKNSLELKIPGKLAIIFLVVLCLNWGWDFYRNLKVFRAWGSMSSLSEFDRTQGLEKSLKRQ